jgi:ribosomal-protein-alanine N-acetyltransferase
VIRPARADDAATLAALQSLLDAPSPRLLATYAAVGTCLVSVRSDSGEAPADREPVGYVLAIGDDDVYVAELVVHPEHRREGRGRALLAAVLARRHPGERVTITVAADNEPARSLYESVGFRRVDRQPGFYDSGPGDAADAVVYAYDVPPEDRTGG